MVVRVSHLCGCQAYNLMQSNSKTYSRVGARSDEIVFNCGYWGEDSRDRRPSKLGNLLNVFQNRSLWLWSAGLVQPVTWGPVKAANGPLVTVTHTVKVHCYVLMLYQHTVFIHRQACSQWESHCGAFSSRHGDHHVWWDHTVSFASVRNYPVGILLYQFVIINMLAFLWICSTQKH